MKSISGFTVIEVLMVVVILSIISIASTNLLFTSLGGSGKAAGLAMLKQNGDHAISLIERNVRWADSASCPGIAQLEFENSDGENVIVEITADVGGQKRISYTEDGVLTYLTGEQLEASEFTCTAISSPNDPTVVDLSFKLTLDPGGEPSTTVTETFRTRVSLRTY